MRRKPLFVALVGVALCIAGCTNLKPQADQTLTAIDGALADVRSEAAAYVPDLLRDVELSTASLRDAMTKKEYQRVIEDGRSVLMHAEALRDAIATKKHELTGQWEALAGGLPGVVETIKGRLDTLATSRKLPAGVTREALAGAKTSFGSLESIWSQASEAFKNGEIMDAVTKGEQVKKTAAEIMTALGMEVPPALASN